MDNQEGNFLYPGFPGIGAPPPDYRPKRNMLTRWTTTHLQKEIAHPLNEIHPKCTFKNYLEKTLLLHNE